MQRIAFSRIDIKKLEKGVLIYVLKSFEGKLSRAFKTPQHFL